MPFVDKISKRKGNHFYNCNDAGSINLLLFTEFNASVVYVTKYIDTDTSSKVGKYVDDGNILRL